jgi:predicted ferric reductase
MNLAITLLAEGGCTFGAVVPVVQPTFKTAKTHGIIMWLAWTLVGVAQIWTGRYLVHWWRWRQFFHSTLGGLMGVLTIAGTVLILKFLKFQYYFNHLHNVAGMVCALLGLLLVLGGIFALVLRRVVNNDWKTKQMLQMTMGHRIFGYFMIFAVQIAVNSGISRYFGIIPSQDVAMK